MSILRRAALLLTALALFAGAPRDAAATMVVEMDLDANVRAADTVVRGQVISKEAGTYQNPQNNALIPVSLYTFEVDRTYIGKSEPKTVTLMNPGGVQLSPTRAVAMPSGFIDYPEGQELILILEEGAPGRMVTPGLHQSVYRVERDATRGTETIVRYDSRATVVNRDGAPAAPLFEKTVFTGEEFESALREAAGRHGKTFIEADDTAPAKPRDAAPEEDTATGTEETEE